MPRRDVSETRQRISDLHSKGLTPREIAGLLNLSVQRIYQQHKLMGLPPNPRRKEAS